MCALLALVGLAASQWAVMSSFSDLLCAGTGPFFLFLLLLFPGSLHHNRLPVE